MVVGTAVMVIETECGGLASKFSEKAGFNRADRYETAARFPLNNEQ